MRRRLPQSSLCDLARQGERARLDGLDFGVALRRDGVEAVRRLGQGGEMGVVGSRFCGAITGAPRAGR